MNTSTQRRIVMTGGLGGIGRAIAMRLASDGHRLCLGYSRTTDETAQAFIASLPGEHHAVYRADLSDPAAAAELATYAAEALGGLDSAIHTAADPIARGNLADISHEDFRSQFPVTVFGGFAFIQATVPYLKESGRGSIIALTTCALYEQQPSRMGAYLAAKAALRALLKEWSLELAPDIDVHAVAPGFVPTAFHADLPEPVLAFLKERAPSVTPEEVADVVSHLLRDKVRGTTGKTWWVPFGESVPL
jgi:NAD(P)-dependent dehydrogenase (short-subunit alcohol dehydrogenase family)